MEWNIVAEFVSLLIIFILMVYAKEYNLLPTRKNKMFRGCLNFVFMEIFVSILSIYAIEYYQAIPEVLNQIIQTLYFLASPMIAVLFLFYLITVIMEDSPRIGHYFRMAFIPFAGYAVLVMTNPFTALLYYFTASQGFQFGNGFFLVYCVPALYMFTMIVFILKHSAKMEKTMTMILISFPVISLLMLIMQWLLPTVILSGSGAAAALLILYLYLQNKQIVIDDLTGLQNRKAFAKILSLSVEHKRKMEILLLSLDDFRLINDRFGQTNGDYFLHAVSRYLATLAPIKSIFRYGGDEFILISDPAIAGGAQGLAENIRRRFGEVWKNDGIQTMLSTSIAIVKYPDHADTVENLITLVEYCTDLSKRSGKGKTIFADLETVHQLNRKTQIIRLMKLGMVQDAFTVVYQPIFSRKAGRFTMAEALLRFSDDQLGVISPSEFIPIAEDAGLINQLGLIVLEKVCRFLKEIEKQNVEVESISINISTLHLNSENFVEKCLEIIDASGVSPQKLRMEVTESVFIGKDGHAEKVLRHLNERGIQFFMDDFGTGYANIANIINLPFECIKFDKAFLYESISDPRALSVLKGLCTAFSDVGMKVVLEGVENAKQLQLAEDINVDYIQGFYFARPMPAAEALGYLGKTDPKATVAQK